MRHRDPTVTQALGIDFTPAVLWMNVRGFYGARKRPAALLDTQAGSSKVRFSKIFGIGSSPKSARA